MIALLVQVALAAPPPPVFDTLLKKRRAPIAACTQLFGTPAGVRLGCDDTTGAPADTLRRRRLKPIEYSDGYHGRLNLHRALSYAMIPLFIGSGYTGFQLRNKGDQAPKWTRDLHGPLAGATAIVFGMNTLTGVWNLWEGRKEPAHRTKRLLHSALFLAAGAGFTYVTIAGDNIKATGESNHWHRDIAVASMSVSLVSWSMMAIFK